MKKIHKRRSIGQSMIGGDFITNDIDPEELIQKD